MNITFTSESVPELTITGATLAELGFGLGEPLQLTLGTMGCGSPSSPMTLPGRSCAKPVSTAPIWVLTG